MNTLDLDEFKTPGSMKHVDRPILFTKLDNSTECLAKAEVQVTLGAHGGPYPKLPDYNIGWQGHSRSSRRKARLTSRRCSRPSCRYSLHRRWWGQTFFHNISCRHCALRVFWGSPRPMRVFNPLRTVWGCFVFSSLAKCRV